VLHYHKTFNVRTSSIKTLNPAAQIISFISLTDVLLMYHTHGKACCLDISGYSIFQHRILENKMPVLSEPPCIDGHCILLCLASAGTI